MDKLTAHYITMSVITMTHEIKGLLNHSRPFNMVFVGPAIFDAMLLDGMMSVRNETAIPYSGFEFVRGTIGSDYSIKINFRAGTDTSYPYRKYITLCEQVVKDILDKSVNPRHRQLKLDFGEMYE